MRDEIEVFMDAAFTYNEQKQAVVLAVDKYQFERALRDLLARARAGERFDPIEVLS